MGTSAVQEVSDENYQSRYEIKVSVPTTPTTARTKNDNDGGPMDIETTDTSAELDGTEVEQETTADVEELVENEGYLFGDFAVLSDNDLSELTVSRIKELETEKASRLLRLFELRVMDQVESTEYLTVSKEVHMYSLLISRHVEAHNKKFGGN